MSEDSPPTNPAQQLFDLLQKWTITPANETVIDRRGGEERWWRAHSTAMQLLNEVEDHLAAVTPRMPGSAPIMLESIERIKHAIFATDTTMLAATSSERTHLGSLDLSALQLMAATWAGEVLDGDSLRSLRAAADETAAMLADADWMDQTSRVYLFTLVNHLQRAVGEVGILGAARVQSLAAELSGALLAFMGGTDQEPQAKKIILRLLDGVRNVFVRDVAPTAAKALTSGLMDQILPPQ